MGGVNRQGDVPLAGVISAGGQAGAPLRWRLLAEAGGLGGHD